MLCLKTPLKSAEKVKKKLLEQDLLRKSHIAKKDDEYIYFPVTQRFKTRHRFVHKLLKKKKQRTSLKKSLKQKLSSSEMKKVRTSMDVIGSIAIIEIPEELEKKKKRIAKQVLKTKKNVKTVLKKGKHSGVYRTQKLKHLAGEKTKKTIHTENNVKLHLDVEKVYFSPRLSNERKRVYKQVKQDEEVLVMFSGCGPYTCVIAKNSPARHVTGVEINPEAHNYALQNVLANKLKNTSVFLGDVKSIVPRLGKKFDRIIMPLPKSAGDYLDLALRHAKKRAYVHFYDFKHEDKEQESVDKIKSACRKMKKKCRILRVVKCGQHAPKVYRICVDFRVL